MVLQLLLVSFIGLYLYLSVLSLKSVSLVIYISAKKCKMRINEAVILMVNS